MRDLPVLAVGEIPDELSQLVRDRDPAGRFARTLANRPLLPRKEHRAQTAAFDTDDGEVDGVLDGQPVEEPRLLVRAREAELRPVAGGPFRDVLAEELDRARRRRDVATDDVEERRLPGAVRSEDRPALAVDDVEVDARRRREARRTAGRPPASGGSTRRVRRPVLLRSPTYLMTWLVMMPFLTTLIFPCQGSLRFTQGG